MKLQDAQYVSIGQAAKLIGLSIPTLRRYEKSGKFSSCFRTFGLHRRYDVNNIRKLLNKENDNKTICYARVSSAGQKNDLTTQVEKLTTYCEDKHYDNVEVIQEVGSGLNYKKKDLINS